MQQLVQRMLLRLGTQMTLVHGEQRVNIYAMLQHTRSKSWQNMEKKMSLLGRVRSGQYVYIGPAQPAAQVGDHLLLNGQSYELRRVEPIWFRNHPMYCWGLCVQKGSADE